MAAGVNVARTEQRVQNSLVTLPPDLTAASAIRTIRQLDYSLESEYSAGYVFQVSRPNDSQVSNKDIYLSISTCLKSGIYLHPLTIHELLDSSK